MQVNGCRLTENGALLKCMHWGIIIHIVCMCFTGCSAHMGIGLQIILLAIIVFVTFSINQISTKRVFHYNCNMSMNRLNTYMFL